MKTLPLLFVCLLPFAACGKTDPSTPTTPPKSGTAEPMDHGHGEEKPLGTLTIGAHTFQLLQLGDVAAGKEAVFELALAKDKPVPALVRGWVGVESGEGSMKARFGKEGDHGLHAHLEVPKALPAGSKLWIEIEENGKTERGSSAWK